MKMSLKIEDFHALLTSDDSPLLTSLGELRAIEKLEEIVDAISAVAQQWIEL